MESISGVDSGEISRFLELNLIIAGIDHDVVGADLDIAVVALFRIGGRNHKEGTLFVIGAFITAEETSGKREAIIPKKKYFYPGIGGDVIMIFENNIFWSHPIFEVLGSRKRLNGARGLIARKQGRAVITEAL